MVRRRGRSGEWAAAEAGAVQRVATTLALAIALDRAKSEEVSAQVGIHS